MNGRCAFLNSRLGDYAVCTLRLDNLESEGKTFEGLEEWEKRRCLCDCLDYNSCGLRRIELASQGLASF